MFVFVHFGDRMLFCVLLAHSCPFALAIAPSVAMYVCASRYCYLRVPGSDGDVQGFGVMSFVWTGLACALSCCSCRC